MNTSTQIIAVSRLTKVAGLLLAVTLSACGGGGTSNSPANDQSAAIDKPPTPATSPLSFSAMGYGYKVEKGEPFKTYTGFNAALDASSNIALTVLDSSNANSYSFTFPSGLPGGSVVASHIFSSSNGAANKDVKLLTPSATTTVQNFFWRNTNDPAIGGLAQAGYWSNPENLIWPAFGTATYAGKAFQYLIEADTSSYSLYSSDVTVSVDYAAKAVAIALAENPVLVDSVGTPKAIDLSKLTTKATLTDISYRTQTKSNASFYSGLGFMASATNIRFYGANAEEFGATLQLWGTLPGTTQHANQFISFALRKQ
jgi:hypothetical protein